MQGLAADGVREGQGKGVQRLPVDQIGDDLLAALTEHRVVVCGIACARISVQASIRERVTMAIQVVTEDRIADIGQMDADLVRASGFEL